MALFIVGTLCGVSWGMLRMGREIERLTLDNAVLLDDVERIAGELASRERALTARMNQPIRSVEIEVENISEEHVRLHLEQQAHELLRHLVGEEVSDVNALLIEGALRRNIRVDRQDYIIEPTLIVVGPEIFVRIDARVGTLDVTH